MFTDRRHAHINIKQTNTLKPCVLTNNRNVRITIKQHYNLKHIYVYKSLKCSY